MKFISRLLVPAMLSLAATLPVSQIAAEETITAKELAARLSANITDGSSYIRLTMMINGAGGKSTLQLQIKERRTKAGTDILYQVLYPKNRKGEAVLLQRQGGKTSGKVLAPGAAVQKIASMKDAMFGSDLSYEDIIENFFSWDQQSFAGTEQVGNTVCQILESKGGASSYSKVRSWIDLKKMVPLRVEKYSGSTLVRRIETTRVAKDDNDRSVVASLTAQRPGQSSETEIEGKDSKHDVVYTDKDFSDEGMQSLTPPPSK